MDVRTNILIGLSRIGTALRSQARRDAAPRGLTPTQAEILAVLRARGAPLRAGQLADQLAITAQTATESLGALQRKGLVRKDRSPDDGRALAVRLTDAGRAVAAEIATWPDALADVVDTLSAEERAVLLRSVLKMIRTLQERGRIAPSRMCITCRFFRPHRHAGTDRPHHCAFVDEPLADDALRVDCGDHEAAEEAERDRIRETFLALPAPSR